MLLSCCGNCDIHAGGRYRRAKERSYQPNNAIDVQRNHNYGTDPKKNSLMA
jgi:hypothetical protein